jgi:hypothetical protein
MMNLDQRIYDELKSISWFSKIGFGQNELESSVEIHWLSSWEDAVDESRSDLWQDVRTEAQGDLTGYLAKNHPNDYGGCWNKLAKQSRTIVLAEVLPLVQSALSQRQPPQELVDSITLDINRIALWASYRKRFAKVPTFFGDLLSVYRVGHFPCGWYGLLSAWPSGRLKVI